MLTWQWECKLLNLNVQLLVWWITSLFIIDQILISWLQGIFLLLVTLLKQRMLFFYTDLYLFRLLKNSVFIYALCDRRPMWRRWTFNANFTIIYIWCGRCACADRPASGAWMAALQIQTDRSACKCWLWFAFPIRSRPFIYQNATIWTCIYICVQLISVYMCVSFSSNGSIRFL